jgi:hypothetical protein
MKKFLVVGALALTSAAIFHQQAFAWKNTQFSVGLNWSHQSGGNNLLWGAFRNGQPGCADYSCCQPNCGYGAGAMGASMGGYPTNAMTPPAPTTFQPSAPATFQPPMPTPVVPHSQLWYANPGYQTVNFAPESYDYGFSYILR